MRKNPTASPINSDNTPTPPKFTNPTCREEEKFRLPNSKFNTPNEDPISANNIKSMEMQVEFEEFKRENKCVTLAELSFRSEDNLEPEAKHETITPPTPPIHRQLQVPMTATTNKDQLVNDNSLTGQQLTLLLQKFNNLVNSEK